MRYQRREGGQTARGSGPQSIIAIATARGSQNPRGRNAVNNPLRRRLAAAAHRSFAASRCQALTGMSCNGPRWPTNESTRAPPRERWNRICRISSSMLFHGRGPSIRIGRTSMQGRRRTIANPQLGQRVPAEQRSTWPRCEHLSFALAVSCDGYRGCDAFPGVMRAAAAR
jgi:hypothetical protein